MKNTWHGYVIGGMIGLIGGFVFAASLSAKSDRRAADTGYMTIDQEVFRLVPLATWQDMIHQKEKP